MEMKPQLITCGWCQTRTTVLPVLGPEPPPPGIWDVADSLMNYAIFQCVNCRGRLVAEWESFGVDWLLDEKPVWYPKPPSANEYPGVPESIADTARESWSCYEGDHYRPAVTNARTVIEQVGKDHELTDDGIQAKIEAMVDAGELPEWIKAPVVALKKAGNTMVHGDPGVSFTAAETETLLTVMDQMLEEVYVSPKRIQELTQAVSALGRSSGTDTDDDIGDSQGTSETADQ